MTHSSWLQLLAADLFLSQGGYGENGFAGCCFEMRITGAAGGRVKFCDLILLGPSRQELLPAVLLDQQPQWRTTALRQIKSSHLSNY